MKKKILLCAGLLIAGLQAPQMEAMFNGYPVVDSEPTLKTSRLESIPVIGKFFTERYDRQYKQEMQNFLGKQRTEIRQDSEEVINDSKTEPWIKVEVPMNKIGG